MNKKNILVSSLVFGLLMASAAQCPSKNAGETAKNENEKKFGALKTSIENLINAKEGDLKEGSLKEKVVDALKELGLNTVAPSGSGMEDKSLDKFFSIVLKEGSDISYSELNEFRSGDRIDNDFSKLLTLDDVKKVLGEEKEGAKKGGDS